MTRYAYFHGEIVPIEQAKVSIMTNTFNYGTGCFGGIRGYWNEERQQLYVFRILDHYRRFLDSAHILLAQLDYTPEQLAQITVDLLSKEGWRQNCYIRPIAYKADESIVVRLHDLQDKVAIFSQPVGNYLPIAEGISVGTSSWRRVDDTMIPARGKIIGSYVNSALIKSEAQLNGFDDAIVLNQDGHVSEGSAANFAMIRKGVLVTPPTSSNILEGITRRTVIQLAQEEMGLPVEIREIDRSEVYLAEEAFYCGTGAQVSPIVSIDHRPIGTGKVGPLVAELQALYFRVVKGEVERYTDWLTPVPQAVTA
ncbi:MAG: branched-chain amino acid transaminase [Caldilineaceae bacterium]|nr:branched-chain amino acid transaminase [Caldilineaceae bacterium]